MGTIEHSAGDHRLQARRGTNLARTAWGYVLAILLVAAAILLRWSLPSVLASTPYLAFYPAMVAAAGLGGMGPGLLAAVASALAVDLLFDETAGRIEVTNPVVLFRLAIFLAGGIGISLFAGFRRAAQARERAQAEELKELAAITDLGHVLVLDEDCRILRWSEGAHLLYGYTSDQAVGKTSHELLHTQFPEPLEQIRGALRQQGRWKGELLQQRADGKAVTVASLWVLRSESKTRPIVFEVDNDITDLKHAQEKLRINEERYRSFVTATSQVVWNMAPGGAAGEDLPLWRAFTGQSEQEIRGFGWLDAVHPDDRARVAEVWRKATAARDVYEVEYRLRTADGQWRDVLARGVPVLNRDGSIREYVGTCIDITERKQADALLRESEERFRGTFDNAAVGITHVSTDGRFIRVNQKFCEILGYTCEELMGRHFTQLTHPDDRKEDAALYVSMARGHQDHYTMEKRYLRRDGSVMWVQVTRSMQRDRAGQPLYSINVVQDISKRKRAEEALEAARESAERAKLQAEHASRAKDHFMAVLSHELRTPLTPVLATVSMLQEQPPDESTRESLDIVRRNVELEARLIDDLLDVTRIARGKVQLDRRPIELQTVINRAIEVCRPDIDARRLDFGVDWGPGPYWVNGDAARLQQVFWNLLKNAIKFTPHGGCIGVRCRLDDHSVVAEVNDSGIGIEPDALARIFNAFEQAEYAIARQFGGLGLGLTICKAMIEMHGGSITAHSGGKGKGASFRVRLPLTAAAEIPEGAPRRAPSAEKKPAGLRILFVEDHGDTARIMKRMLERRGHDVQTAGDVATSLELVGTNHFDLLISDLGLPDGSGLDLMRRLREQGTHLKGIALSGYGMDQDVQRSREAGFSEHLIKPVQIGQLQAAIGRVMATSGAGEAAR